MQEQAEAKAVRRWGPFILCVGILLPAISIIVETTTHMCAEELFDPIPTMWHEMLVIFVPLANLQVLWAIRKGRVERASLLGLSNAVAIGISLFYTIVYIPLFPIAVIMVFVGGLGLLPMAPLFSLISGLILRRQLRRVAPTRFALRTSGLAAGLALTFTVIVLIELPASLTRSGLQMAASDSAERSAEGIRWLRAFGNRDYMLRACYGRSGRATDLAGYLFSLQDPVSPDEARKIYYRVTGETFNTSVPPQRVGGRLIPQDDTDFDMDQGGTVIAGKVKGLSLASSRIDGSMDADAGVGYMEWTLVFRNESASQQEARAQVRLPPGAVVSRLTLWINGEEREAAFGGRSRVRQAYQQVVSRRRDPVLVTTAGRDRILVQCFPVPPDGGEMKVRVGITVPLVLEDKAQARLLLPHFLDRNFRIPDALNHAVWIESETELQSENKSLRAERRAGANLYALRGATSDSELLNPKTSIRLSRTGEITQAWTRNSVKGDKEIVRQFIQFKETERPSRVILVLDTSRSMRDWSREISSALKTFPSNVEIKLVLAGGNGLYEEGVRQLSVTGSPEKIAVRVDGLIFEGGADNVPALVKAWDMASENPGSVIVWIHGPQLLQLQSVEELRQRWERRPEGPALYAVQAGNGPDRIEEMLDGIRPVHSVARMGSLESDLKNLFSQFAGRVEPLEFIRYNYEPEQMPEATHIKETSAHLARLWASDEVGRLMSEGDDKSVEAATELAVRYQLVTPVSGAVVLETEEQYKQAGLQPVEAGTVPTIPEPEMIMLVAVVAAIFLYLLYRRKLLRPKYTSGGVA